MNRHSTAVSFTFIPIFIFFLFLSTTILAQSTVTGRVVDSTNEGVPRVSVVVKGANRGTVTDAAGNFRINASTNDVLVISSLGYGTQEISVRGTGPITVTLAQQTAQLSDVVVIGYGQKSRKLLTESIGTVAAKDIQKLPVASADAAMQGRVSGVQISNVDGSPGSPVSVRVRGVGTVGNSQPLFVIDGVPIGNGGGGNTNPLANINPNDIENISVLKDASSAAIYGMRAANGVVLITTKRGKSGKPRVSFDAYYGIANFPKQLRANNTQQYIALAQDALDNRNRQDNLTPGQTGFQVLPVDLVAGTPNSVTNINTDWQAATFNKNAPVVNYNIGVSGGSENSNYFLSAGYFKQEAVTKNWTLGRYSMRANSDYKVGSRFKVGQTLTLSFQEVKRGINGGGDGFLYANNLSMPPFFKIYDDENKIPGNRYGFNGNSNVAGFTIGNQLALNEIVKNTDHTYRLIGGLYAELEALRGLKLRSAASIDFGFGRNTNWQPAYTDKEIGFGREANNFGDNRSQGYTQVFTNTVSYERTIKEHFFNLIAGVEYQKLRGNNLSYSGTNFQSTDPSFYQVVSNGRGTNGQFANAGSGAGNEAFARTFARLSYNFKEKYLLTATVGREGSSRFISEKRFGVFPAVSAAWRISEEDFMKNISFISDLKLRGSYGELGNANTSNFEYISRVTVTPQYPLNGVAVQAPTPAGLPNVNLGWETVKSLDFGVDASLFNNKVNFLATYYRRNTTDFLIPLPVPFSSGFGGTQINLGEVENKGFEFELGYNTKVFRAVNFNVSANLTTLKNKLVSLTPGVEEFSSGNYRTAIGYPIGYFYGYKALGIYQTPAQAAAALPDNVAGQRPRAGDLIFQDNNSPLAGAPNGKQFADSADGRITPDDRTYLGKTIPDFFYGLNLSANYKGLDMSVLFQGVSGIQVYNQLRQNMEGLGGPGRNQLATTENRWKGEGTSNTMPRAVAGDPYNNNRFSSRWVENASFLRLKNIQIGYSLPQNFLTKTHVFNSARIYVGATNLFTITNYTGLDPEVVTFGSASSQLGAGTDQGSTPQPRTFQAGINLNF
jgi:TonB-linked SusC/RagA family outer membrane protein